MMHSSQLGVSLLVIPPYLAEQLIELRQHSLLPKKKLQFQAIYTYRSSKIYQSSLSFSMGYNPLTSIFTPFSIMLLYCACGVWYG